MTRKISWPWAMCFSWKSCRGIRFSGDTRLHTTKAKRSWGGWRYRCINYGMEIPKGFMDKFWTREETGGETTGRNRVMWRGQWKKKKRERTDDKRGLSCEWWQKKTSIWALVALLPVRSVDIWDSAVGQRWAQRLEYTAGLPILCGPLALRAAPLWHEGELLSPPHDPRAGAVTGLRVVPCARDLMQPWHFYPPRWGMNTNLIFNHFTSAPSS